LCDACGGLREGGREGGHENWRREALAAGKKEMEKEEEVRSPVASI